jgi:signal peptidase I
MAALLFTSAIAQAAEQPWIRGIYTGQSPRPVTAAEAEAWQQASILAENTPDAFVLVGLGRSMQPLYAPGTILVLQQRPYAELKRGQTALYRTKQQHVVAHVLVAKARDGWRVQGLNNAIHDMEPVVAENLVGIVVAAFNPVTPARSMQVAMLH